MNKKHLFHAGIKGMKWGLRRFQYTDGSLTPLGRERYGVKGGTDEDAKANMYKDINKVYGSVKNLENQGERNLENLDRTGKVLDSTSKILKDTSQIGANSKKSKVVNEKDYSHMSDDEIRKRINRISMERTYGELTGDTKRVRSGEDWTREILQTTGALVGIAGTITGIILTINSIKTKKPKGGN